MSLALELFKEKIPEKYWGVISEHPDRIYAKRIESFAEKIVPYLSQCALFEKAPFQIHMGSGYLGSGSFPTCYDAYLDDDFSALAHEIGHALEFHDRLSVEKSRERFASHFWGLKYESSVELMGEIYYEPRTFQSSLLETRVVGIEMRILEMSGYTPEKVQKIKMSQSRALNNFMSDSFLNPAPDINKREEYLQELIQESYEKWPAHRVMKAWEEVAPTMNALNQGYRQERGWKPIVQAVEPVVAVSRPSPFKLR